MDRFRELLRTVDAYYEGFEHAVVSYIKMPGNENKMKMIEEYVINHPAANSSDVLEFMMNETGFWQVYSSKDNNLQTMV